MKRMPSWVAIGEDMTLEVCITSIIVAHAGAVRFSGLMNFVSCGGITLNCGRGFWIWIGEPFVNLEKAPWGVSKSGGVWSSLNIGLCKRMYRKNLASF